MKVAVTLFLATICALVSAEEYQYEPTWDSLDKRPLPQWYDEAKIGIFLHWGLFSVPSFGSEWFWNNWRAGSKPYVDFMNQNYRPDFTYADFGRDFTVEFFNPNEWVDIFKSAGAQYIVLTSKHHEGYTMWPSKYSFGWNSLDVGPRRDLLGSLAAAVRNNSDIHFGVYHSLMDWFHPLYLEDKKNKFETQNFVKAKAMPELVELIDRYNPEVIWSDGDWEAPDTYWNSTYFLAWLYNSSPVKEYIVVNDRWGQNIPCHHGDFYTCTDRYNPGVLQPHKWEDAMTVDRKSWGYRREAKLADILTISELLTDLAETISCGGNLLVNVGPSKEGRIMPIYEERLRQMGRWLDINGEAIYKSKPWVYQNDTLTKGIWYTQKGSGDSLTVYAIVLAWPQKDTLELGSPVPGAETKVTMLGYDDKVFLPNRVLPSTSTWQIAFPPKNEVKGEWAWVLRITHLSTQ